MQDSQQENQISCNMKLCKFLQVSSTWVIEQVTCVSPTAHKRNILFGDNKLLFKNVPTRSNQQLATLIEHFCAKLFSDYNFVLHYYTIFAIYRHVKKYVHAINRFTVVCHKWVMFDILLWDGSRFYKIHSYFYLVSTHLFHKNECNYFRNCTGRKVSG